MAKIIFMGSPEIAVPSLQALHEAGHEILAVVTQPDRPKGRGQSVTAPAVKLAAQALGLNILQPEKINSPDFVQTLRELSPELVIVVAYGKILKKEILTLPEIACVNLHFSLLPKYRGASCVAQALLHGDEETGVTTIVMDEGLDTGPILMQWSETIEPDETSESLAKKLSLLGAQQLQKTVEALERGTIDATPQTEEGASYAPLLTKEMGKIDWQKSAREIYNQFRGLTPWPGVFSFLKGLRLVLTEIRPLADSVAQQVGALKIDEQGRMRVQCGEGSIEVMKLKPEAKKVMSAVDFVRGLQGKEEIVLT